MQSINSFNLYVIFSKMDGVVRMRDGKEVTYLDGDYTDAVQTIDAARIQATMETIGLWKKVKWGDIIEDRHSSGYRTCGLYFVAKMNPESNDNDDTLRVIYMDEDIPNQLYCPLLTPSAIYCNYKTVTQKHESDFYWNGTWVPIIPSMLTFNGKTVELDFKCDNRVKTAYIGCYGGYEYAFINVDIEKFKKIDFVVYVDHITSSENLGSKYFKNFNGFVLEYCGDYTRIDYPEAQNELYMKELFSARNFIAEKIKKRKNQGTHASPVTADAIEAKPMSL